MSTVEPLDVTIPGRSLTSRISAISRSTLVIKASGEALGFPFDEAAFIATAHQIRQIASAGHGVAVIVGGGNIVRGADLVRQWTSISSDAADAAGMLGTGVNAVLLGDVLRSLGMRAEVVPRGPLTGMVNGGWGTDAIRGALAEGVIVIIAGGLGVPGMSSDVAALSLAAGVKAEAVIMGKHDVDAVYTADPKIHPATATRIPELTASDALFSNLAFIDRQALEIAIRERITIRVIAAASDDALVRASQGERIGTVVHPR